MALPLDALDLLDRLDPVGQPEEGVPLQLAVDSIDEDPEQPRREFDEAALAELAETVRERGVRQPVSVRPHPADRGRWMLNFGARRLRAARQAGLVMIPAFVDVTADRYDQVIENEQRQGLTPMELALFVQRRLALGERQAEVARRLGKSRGYLTQVCALIDAPPWLLDAYRSGRCRGVTELYALRRLGETDPAAAEAVLEQGGPVRRRDLARGPSASGEGGAEPLDGLAGPAVRTVEPVLTLVLQGQVDGQAVRVELGAASDGEKRVRVIRLVDGAVELVTMDRILKLSLEWLPIDGAC